jgi:hypothetical protein
MRIPGLFVALAGLVSCAPFGGDADLRAIMPRIPVHWSPAFPDLRFRLVFPGPGEEERELEIPPAVAARISCPKASNTAILAYPEAAGAAGCLPPAGALYPLDLQREAGEDALLFSWEAGCTAWILSRLHTRGFDTTLVNAARLRAELARHADPWALDLQKIVEKLAAGTFTAYDIDSLPSRDVQLMPGAGEWFLESPFRNVSSLADGETLLLPGVSMGRHTLFSVSGGQCHVFVGEKETVISR